MHENLKYTVRLNEEIKPFTSMELREQSYSNRDAKSDISDWQAIYSGNDYGTHYLIYGKFIGKKHESGGFVIDKVQLFIQNYTGAVTIGFSEFNLFELLNDVNEDVEDPENDIRYPNRKRFQLTVSLEGFKSDNIIQKEVSLLQESLLVNNGDILVVSPFFTPVDNHLSKIFNPKDRNHAPFVDEKFLVRVGEDIFISEEGERNLRMLNDMEIISNEKLLLTGLNTDENNQLESKGKVYPCDGWSSIFYV